MQSGILEWFLKERVPCEFGGSEIILDQFASNKLFQATPPEPEIKFGNVHKLFILFPSLLAVATVVLLMEILKHKLDEWHQIRSGRTGRAKQVRRIATRNSNRTYVTNFTPKRDGVPETFRRVIR